jgi:hypothetical protein
MLLSLLLAPAILPFLPGMQFMLLLFNDYVYLRHCAFQIKICRKFYATLPSDTRDLISYYDFLKMRGKPGVIRCVLETLIAFFLIVMIAQYFGVTLGVVPGGTGS